MSSIVRSFYKCMEELCLSDLQCCDMLVVVTDKVLFKNFLISELELLCFDVISSILLVGLFIGTQSFSVATSFSTTQLLRQS
jgi:hypothetical protein